MSPPEETGSTAPAQADEHFRSADRSLVALVEGAFADAAARSGKHLLCRPGCAQCCVGVFAIGPADRLRLAEGLSAVRESDPERAARVRDRAQASWARLAAEFPGNAATGIVSDSPGDAFDAFGNEEVCPALDPHLGTCDLYPHRPHTCRVFGPPAVVEGGYSVCELCFTHATAEEVAHAALASEAAHPPDGIDELAVAAGEQPGETIVAFVLAQLIPE